VSSLLGDWSRSRKTRYCEHTVVKDGQPQQCGRPIIDTIDEVCDRPSDHTD
jgi:hypothetical protein